MTSQLRIPRVLYERARQDLHRSHSFAFERVGFMYGRAAAAMKTNLVLMSDYEPIDDDSYLKDRLVGARINGAAIRHAMQRALDTGESVFHVHVHDHRGEPRFSHIDKQELDRLVPSFGHVAPSIPHGALLLSSDRGVARVWPPAGASPEYAEQVSVVGYPISMWRSA
jgi:hypothetical protein